MTPLDQMMFLQPGDSVVLNCDFATANALASQYISRPYALEKLAANQTRITLHDDREPHRDVTLKIVGLIAVVVITFILITRP